MADIIFNPVAGVPFSGGNRMVDCGDGTWAMIGMSLTGPPPTLSLSNVSAVGPGATVDNHGVRSNHSLVVVSGAGVSGGVVALQGSQDGTNWFNFTPAVTITTSTASTVFPIATGTLTPVRLLRANITTVITGGTISAWVSSGA